MWKIKTNYKSGISRVFVFDKKQQVVQIQVVDRPCGYSGEACLMVARRLPLIGKKFRN